MTGAKRNLLLAAILLLAGCSLWPAEQNPYTTIHPSTDFGMAIQGMYEMVTYWVVGIAIGVFALLAFVLIRYRDDGSPGNPKQIHGNTQLELAWTLLPVAIVIAITIPTIRTIFEIGDTAPKDALEIRVVGRRWWWVFEYADTKLVTANEIHVPVGRPISLKLESDTVIHSFWAPRLGGKRDAVPGRTNRIWFTIQDEAKPGQPIEYLGECAEFCGEQHARMRFRVYGHTESDFQRWLTDMQAPVEFADPEVKRKGEEAFTAGGCVGCHAITGNSAATGVKGPNLTRFGQRHSVGAGAGVFDGIDDAAKASMLKQWITDPDSIKSGTTKEHNISRELDGMNVPVKLTDEQADAIVAYLLAQK